MSDVAVVGVVAEAPKKTRAERARERSVKRMTENVGADDQPFLDWMVECDLIVDRKLGVSLSDLEDWRWRDAYDDQYTPGDAVTEAIEELGYDEEGEGE